MEGFIITPFIILVSMKRFIISLLLTPSLLFGQTQEELDLCMAIQSSGFISNSEAESALEKILNTIGASKNFVLTPCDKINNAIATAYKGTRYILYDKAFMDLISENTNDWSNLFILAHEVGHHINGHLLDILLYMGNDIDSPTLEKKRKQELEADEFAAFVLAKLGANLSDLKSVIEIVSDEQNDIYSTHPNTEKRIASVEKGFKKGFVEVKTANPNYVDFEDNESFLKFGDWFREQSKSYLGDITWNSFSEGKNIKIGESNVLSQNLILKAVGKIIGGEYRLLPKNGIAEEIVFLIDENQLKSIILNRFRNFINANNVKEKKYFFGKHNTNPSFFKDRYYKGRELEFTCTIDLSAKNPDGNRIKTRLGGVYGLHESSRSFTVYYDLWGGTIRIRGDGIQRENPSMSPNLYFKYFPLSNNSEINVDKIILKVSFGEIELMKGELGPHIARDYLRTKSPEYESFISSDVKQLPIGFNFEDEFISLKEGDYYISSKLYKYTVFKPYEKKSLFSTLKNQHSSPKTYYFEYDMRGSKKAFSNDFTEESLLDIIKNKYYEYFE